MTETKTVTLELTETECIMLQISMLCRRDFHQKENQPEQAAAYDVLFTKVCGAYTAAEKSATAPELLTFLIANEKSLCNFFEGMDGPFSDRKREIKALITKATGGARVKPKLILYGPIQLCPYCHAEAVQKFSGDEGWTFCSEDCGCLEGQDTVESYSSELSEHHTANELAELETIYDLEFR